MSDETWADFLISRMPELWLRLGEHIALTTAAMSIAIAIGVPLGILAARMRSWRGAITGTVGVLQTIPSLAMLAMLLALLGKIGAIPAVIALTLYALLPIVRNTLAGIDGLEPELQEAARGIGMTPVQRLRIVELPLAMPVIVAGIRTAAVVGVGIATLSAFIGAGGLGQFINSGLALSNTKLILLGAIPAAVLALAVDGSIAVSQWALRPEGVNPRSNRRSIPHAVRVGAALAPLILVGIGAAAYMSSSPNWSGQRKDGPGTIRIGSKNFTEQMILGEILAQMIEAHTELRVDRRFNLGGTMICHEALLQGEIDLYPEYTGTSLTAILGAPLQRDSDATLRFVRERYAEDFGLVWLEPFGFNNTYAMAMRGDHAKSIGAESISDIVAEAQEFRGGFAVEFRERPDGLPGLMESYKLSFGDVRDLDAGLMYRAVASGEVDIICAFSTDGRIEAYKLKILEDDKGFFPPYHAGPVIRQESLDSFPEIEDVLDRLAGQIDDDTMRRLNFSVDEEKRSPRSVARRFLENHDLL